MGRVGGGCDRGGGGGVVWRGGAGERGAGATGGRCGTGRRPGVCRRCGPRRGGRWRRWRSRWGECARRGRSGAGRARCGAARGRGERPATGAWWRTDGAELARRSSPPRRRPCTWTRPWRKRSAPEARCSRLSESRRVGGLFVTAVLTLEGSLCSNGPPEDFPLQIPVTEGEKRYVRRSSSRDDGLAKRGSLRDVPDPLRCRTGRAPGRSGEPVLAPGGEISAP